MTRRLWPCGACEAGRVSPCGSSICRFQTRLRTARTGSTLISGGRAGGEPWDGHARSHWPDTIVSRPRTESNQVHRRGRCEGCCDTCAETAAPAASERACHTTGRRVSLRHANVQRCHRANTRTRVCSSDMCRGGRAPTARASHSMNCRPTCRKWSACCSRRLGSVPTVNPREVVPGIAT
jgi:hypothetical protein